MIAEENPDYAEFMQAGDRARCAELPIHVFAKNGKGTSEEALELGLPWDFPWLTEPRPAALCMECFRLQ